MALTTVAVDTVVMHGYAFAASRLQKLFKNARAMQAAEPGVRRHADGGGCGPFFVKRSHAAAH
jgi:homoserine/homoserine lactone efflux protein